MMELCAQCAVLQSRLLLFPATATTAPPQPLFRNELVTGQMMQIILVQREPHGFCTAVAGLP